MPRVAQPLAVGPGAQQRLLADVLGGVGVVEDVIREAKPEPGVLADLLGQQLAPLPIALRL